MRAVSVLCVVALLAGCSEEAGPDPALQEVPDVEATATTGGIRGVVVDQTILPVQGATVKVVGAQIAPALTDDKGLFVFSGLPAGTYFVEASHPLYDKQQSSTEVKAGVSDPPALKLQLTRLITEEPYLSTQQFQGYITCSVNAIFVLSEECGEGVGVPCSVAGQPVPVVGCQRVAGNPSNHAQIDFNIDNSNAKTLIAEAIWDPSLTVGNTGSQSGGFNMGIYIDWSCLPVCNAAGGTVDRKNSNSPMYLRDDAKLESLAPDETTAFSTFTWASSEETGVLLEQSFEVFISASYFLPLPEDWSFANQDANPF